MSKARGKTKGIILSVSEIERLIGEATACIDTKDQHKIRMLLEAAMAKCQDIRNGYDPV